MSLIRSEPFSPQATSEDDFGIILRSVRAIFQFIHSDSQQQQQLVLSDEEDLLEENRSTLEAGLQV